MILFLALGIILGVAVNGESCNKPIQNTNHHETNFREGAGTRK